MANDEKEKIVNKFQVMGSVFYWLLFLANIFLIIIISPWGSGMDTFTEWGTDAYSPWPQYASKETYYYHVFKRMGTFFAALILADVLYRKKHKVWACIVLLIPYPFFVLVHFLNS